jgi:hypothetical protein
VRAVQQALGRDAVEQGRHAGHRRNPALAVHVHVGAVEAAGEQRGDEPAGAVAQHRRIGTAVERMQIGHEQVHVPPRLGRQLGQRPDRAHVVAEVQIPRRLDSGEGDGRFGCLGHRGHLLGGRTTAGPAQAGPELRPISDEGLKRPAG